MLEEFVESIKNLALASESPTTLDDGKKTGTLTVMRGDKIVEHELRGEHRAHQAYSLDGVTSFANRFWPVKDADQKIGDKDDQPVVWYNRHATTCLLNDNDRRERVTFGYKFSPQYDSIAELSKVGVFDQRSLILWLRTAMAGCMQHCPNLVATVRSVKFSMSSEAAGDEKHGRASLGKSVRSELAQADDVPEEVTFTVPVFQPYSMVFIRANVTVAVEIQPAEQKFRLIPLPGQLELAAGAGEAQIRQWLLDNFEGPIYYGVP